MSTSMEACAQPVVTKAIRATAQVRSSYSFWKKSQGVSSRFRRGLVHAYRGKFPIKFDLLSLELWSFLVLVNLFLNLYIYVSSSIGENVGLRHSRIREMHNTHSI